MYVPHVPVTNKFIYMKIAFLFVLGFLSLPGTSQPLTIIEQDYDKAKLESRAQQKMLLIDFYTTWCVPCKKIDQLIYQDSAFRQQLANDFVVLKYNAEKDSVHGLTAKFHIGLFPSTVVLNPAQFVVNRMYGTGGGTEADWVNNYTHFLQTSIANHRNNQIVPGVSQNNKLHFPDFYKAVINRIKIPNEQDSITAYWANTDSSRYFDEVPFSVLCYFAGGTDAVNDFFLAHKKRYEQLYGDLDVQFILGFLISKKFDAAVKAKNRSFFDKASQLIQENYPATVSSNIIDIWEEKMLIRENQWEKAFDKFMARQRKLSLDDDAINSFCYQASSQCTDMKVLKKCTVLMRGIARKKPSHEMSATYARLLYKTGHLNLAFTEMENAIRNGKTAKEDTRDSETWLNRARQGTTIQF